MIRTEGYGTLRLEFVVSVYEESEANTCIKSGKFNLKSQVQKGIFLSVNYILEKILTRRVDLCSAEEKIIMMICYKKNTAKGNHFTGSCFLAVFGRFLIFSRAFCRCWVEEAMR